MSWRFLNAAARGTSHDRTNAPCQDDCLVDVVSTDDGDVLLAIAADGAGSAACAEEGSALVCESLLREAGRWLHETGTVGQLTRGVIDQWLVAVRTKIEELAGSVERIPRDYACTLIAAIVSTSAAAFMQIGDGAIVAGVDGAYDVIFWPDGGEYANTTFFLTDADWADHLHFELRTTTFDELALMTDGLQRLALQFESRTAHVPFFAPMFAALRNVAPGYASDLEAPLLAFLQSDAVNARTDDDKSLVLATRGSRDVHAAL